MINYYEYLRPKISGIAIIPSKRGKTNYLVTKIIKEKL